jgi:hypothetical protein
MAKKHYATKLKEENAQLRADIYAILDGNFEVSSRYIAMRQLKSSVANALWTKQRYTNPKREALRMAQHHRQSRFFQLKQMANFWPMPSRRFNYCFVPAKPKQSITTGHEGEE